MEKTIYFNIESISYSANIQPDIMHNYLKNMGENKKYFEMTLGNFLDFFC
jgi:hypothetical protein